VRIPSSHTKTLVLEAEARYFGIPVKKPSESAAGPPRRRRRALHIALLVVGCVLFIDALVGDKGLLAMLQARQQYRDLEQSLAEVRAENADLREEAERLREDPTAIEELARRDLGLIKPGEKLFIVKDVPTPNGR
jgi:cell division protein FtsB